MGQPRLLIVDDHPLVRVGLRTALLAAFPAGSVAEAASLGEARATLAANHYDAVILDLTLPDCEPASTYPAIRGCCPDTPVIIVTAADPRDLAEALAVQGAATWLSKASGPEAIIDAIGRLVAIAPEQPAGALRPVLTPRELDILTLCARGLQNKVIGRSLGISENTVRAHLASVFKRFGLAQRGEVKAFLERAGLG